jgi:hypothetical protein
VAGALAFEQGLEADHLRCGVSLEPASERRTGEPAPGSLEQERLAVRPLVPSTVSSQTKLPSNSRNQPAAPPMGEPNTNRSAVIVNG